MYIQIHIVLGGVVGGETLARSLSNFPALSRR